jgi:elongation factor G
LSSFQFEQVFTMTTRELPITRFRNLGILAHVDAGKTTVSERVLYYTGRVRKTGEVHLGNTQLDWTAEEKKHGITITAAATTCYWAPQSGSLAGLDHRVNLIDTPGHVDFTVEVERSLRVLDGAVVVLDAASGVEPQTETVWRQADRYHVPRIVFVNKLDKPGADFAACLVDLRERLAARPVPVQVPLGEGGAFAGVIDLVGDRALYFTDPRARDGFREGPVPEAAREAAARARAALVEACAEWDDEVLETYLAGRDVAAADLERALRKGAIAGTLVPVLCGSAIKDKGVQMLLDAIINFLPSPADLPPVVGARPGSGEALSLPADAGAPLCALAFKVASDKHVGHLTYVRVYSGTLRAGSALLNATRGEAERAGRVLLMHANESEELDEAGAGVICAVVGLRGARTGDTLCAPERPIVLPAMALPEPVVELCLEPARSPDLEKLDLALRKLCSEDPSLRLSTDPETGRPLVKGMGELHLQILAERLESQHGVRVRLGRPRVAFRETLTRAASADVLYKKQNGGTGLYARVALEIAPRPRGAGFAWADATVGGSVPRAFVPWVEKGVRVALTRGKLAGYPVEDVEVRLVDGAAHSKDSNGLAFETAGRLAFEEAASQAGPALLEPFMAVEISTPEAYLGDVIGDLNARRGQVRSIGERGGVKVVSALVALRSLFGYVDALRGRTQGRASASMSFERYDFAPPGVEAGSTS